jgi:large subunit ribosomal protein L32
MAVPKKKTSKSKRNMRRSHHAVKPINVVVNSVTGEYQLPHHISLADGYYRGKKIILEKEPVLEANL